MGLENLKQPNQVPLCGSCSREGECRLIRAVNQIIAARGGELDRKDNRAIRGEVDHYRFWRHCENTEYGDQIISPSPKFR